MFASFMIAAGVNAKALSTYMGHSSITVTFDRYGHLMPGNEAEAAGLLDSYLTLAPTLRRDSRSSPPHWSSHLLAAGWPGLGLQHRFDLVERAFQLCNV